MNLAPLFISGIGYAMFIVSACVGIYYNMIIAWAFYYTFVSFAKDVPWRNCGNPWNSPGMWYIPATLSIHHSLRLFNVCY